MSMAEPSTTDRTYQLAGGAVLHFLPKQKRIIQLDNKTTTKNYYNVGKLKYWESLEKESSALFPLPSAKTYTHVRK